MSATKITFSTVILFAAMTSTASAERFSYFGCILDGGKAQYSAGAWTCVYPNTGTGTVGPQGPQGEAGPQGPKGDTGAAGVAGAKGEKGDQGIPGVAGATGATGPQGIPGVAGPAGADGAAGVAGAKGDKGDQGPQGEAGPAGAQGPKGETGEQGIPGVAGADGAKGDTGAQGPQGVAGVKGDTGEQGPKGDKGDTGATGATGAVGPQGIQGEAGVAGATGAQGEVGPQGIQGEVGAVGPKGDTGAQGIQGEVGPQGPAGTMDPQMAADLNDLVLRVMALELRLKELTPSYAIGDTGPAGGIVFYLDGMGGGLEVAPEDQGRAAVGCDFTLVGTGTAIGTGASNTAAFLDSGCAVGGAAQLASEYRGPTGDTTGWFLPSKDELFEVFDKVSNRGVNCTDVCDRIDLGTDGAYASSSEFDERLVWRKIFYNRTAADTYGKRTSQPVRAIRSFGTFGTRPLP